METRYGPVKLAVPKGFPVLLQRFAREVIREQPDDIVEFGATFFQTLVIERKVTGEDPLECDPFDKPGFHAPPTKVLRPVSSKIRQKEIEHEKAATKIQAGYRGYKVRKTSVKNQKRLEEKLQEEKAATKIQAQYRGYQTRKSISHSAESSKPTEKPETAILEEHEADHHAAQNEQTLDADQSTPPTVTSDEVSIDAEKTDGREVEPEQQNFEAATTNDTDEKTEDATSDISNKEEQEAAALKIQTAYRGHRTRKALDEDNEREKDPSKTHTQEEQEAALKIQASFRGHETRKALKEDNEKVKDLPQTYGQEEQEAALKIQANFRGHKTRKALKEDTEKENDLSELYSQEEQEAALKIQANFRGHKTRKALREDNETVKDIPKNYGQEEEEAALKIQAGFRGHKTRKQLKHENKEDPEQTVGQEDMTEEQNERSAVDTNDREEEAALKIQATFRGHRVRKQMKSENNLGGNNQSPQENHVRPSIIIKNEEEEETYSHEVVLSDNDEQKNDPGVTETLKQEDEQGNSKYEEQPSIKVSFPVDESLQNVEERQISEIQEKHDISNTEDGGQRDDNDAVASEVNKIHDEPVEETVVTDIDYDDKVKDSPHESDDDDQKASTDKDVRDPKVVEAPLEGEYEVDSHSTGAHHDGSGDASAAYLQGKDSTEGVVESVAETPRNEVE